MNGGNIYASHVFNKKNNRGWEEANTTHYSKMEKVMTFQITDQLKKLISNLEEILKIRINLS